MTMRLFFRLCVVIFVTQIIHNGASRLKRIENKVDLLQNHFDTLQDRVDIDRKFRREGMRNLNNKIDNISAVSNLTVKEILCQDKNETNSRSSTSLGSSFETCKMCSHWNQLTQAFKDENALKMNIRDQVSNYFARVQTAEEAISSIDNTLVEVRDGVKAVASNIQTVLTKTATNHQKLREVFTDFVVLKNQLLEAAGVKNDRIETADPRYQLRELNETKNDLDNSCLEIYRKGHRLSGQYDVYPTNRTEPIRVFCDHDTAGGGWTVFQRRTDGSENFYRRWHDYRNGFGNLDGEFWLGNEYLSILTSTCCHQLRIDLENFDGEKRYAMYDVFQVKSVDEQYSLMVSMYSGNAGDSFTYHNGSKFSTKDRDNDQSTDLNCAVRYTGAWWYRNCYASNLNGQYLGRTHSGRGVNWNTWGSYGVRLKSAEMKFRGNI